MEETLEGGRGPPRAVAPFERVKAKGKVIFSAMKMEAVSSYENSVNFYQTHHRKQ